MEEKNEFEKVAHYKNPDSKIEESTPKRINFALIKQKLSGAVMHILILVVVFQVGCVVGWLVHRGQVDKEIQTAIVAEAFVYNDYKDKKFTNSKVLYQIKRFEVQSMSPLQEPK